MMYAYMILATYFYVRIVFFMNLLLDSLWQIAVNQKRKKKIGSTLFITVYAVLQQLAKIRKKVHFTS